MTSSLATPLPSWLLAQLEQVSEHCRIVAQTELGIGLPPIEVVLTQVSPAEEILRTDYQSRIFVALASPDRLSPPPKGANLVYGLAHEVGHMVTIRCLPSGAQLPVLWDEAFAHLIATQIFFPQLEHHFGTNVWPGETPGWTERQAAYVVGEGFADQNAQLERCTNVLTQAMQRFVDPAQFFSQIGELPTRDLGILRIERTFKRFGPPRQ